MDTQHAVVAPNHPDHELTITGHILAALDNLGPDEARRVLDYVVARQTLLPPPA